MLFPANSRETTFDDVSLLAIAQDCPVIHCGQPGFQFPVTHMVLVVAVHEQRIHNRPSVVVPNEVQVRFDDVVVEKVMDRSDRGFGGILPDLLAEFLCGNVCV